MTGDFSRKRLHRLFTAATSAEFDALFLDETGLRVVDAASRFVRPEAIRFVGLAGSIPIGAATGVSDVDLLVVASAGSEIHTTGPTRAEVTFKGRAGGLILAECVRVVNGVEVDVQIVDADRLTELLQRLCQGQSTFTSEELVILSRLATAWPLVHDLGFIDARSPWRASLRMYCATRDYTFALKELEDARAAVSNLPVLALHLGRTAVEYGFRAYLSSKGHAALGSKWMRLLLDDDASRRTGLDEGSASALRGGVGLLFPDVERASPAESDMYLNQVLAFLACARGEIEKDPTMKMAFRVCAQIYAPSQNRP